MSPAVPGDQCRKIENLHGRIKNKLNRLLEGGRARLTPSGNFLVTDKLPPFLQEPDVIQRHFEGLQMGEASDVLGQIDLETWEQHLNYSLNRVRKKKEESGGRYSWEKAEMIIRGCVGELLLQTMLLRMTCKTFDCEERSLKLIGQDDQFVFPETRNNNQCVYSPQFTTKYNCELYARDRARRWCVTEFDGVLLSGLKPGGTDYSRFYAFDATLDRLEFGCKVLSKLHKLADFIAAMDAKGIRVHMFNVLFYGDDLDNQTDRFRSLATGRNHAIALPLLDVVNEIMALTKTDLKNELNALLGPTDQEKKKQTSSPPA